VRTTKAVPHECTRSRSLDVCYHLKVKEFSVIRIDADEEVNGENVLIVDDE
jgi:hypothetical protein